MKNLKHRTKLILLFVITGIIPLVLSSLMEINYTISSMEAMEYNLLQSKLKGDISAAEVYLSQYFGELDREQEQLIDEQGKAIAGQYEMIDKLSTDLSIVSTIFVKREEGYQRVITSIVEEDGNRADGTMLDNEEVVNAVSGGNKYIGDAEILGETYLTVYAPIYNSEKEVIGALFVGVSKAESKDMIVENITSTITKITVIVLFIAALGTVVMLIGARGIVTPLLELVASTTTIAQYNLKDRVSEKLTSRLDEIGVLARALEAIQESLTDMIGSMNNISENVTGTTKELANNCQEARKVAEEMAKTIQDVAQGATDQATSTAECIQRLDRLGTLMDSNQGQMEQLSEASEKVNVVTEVGKQVLDNLSQKISESNKATIEAYQNMQETNESAKQISEASNVIAAIADQTNLLALNASIEAARAGEYGKGFAVVAEEIRKLAEQSAKSTGQIEEQIRKLQKDASNAVLATEKVKDMLKEQTADVALTEGKYQEIAQAIEITQHIIEELNESSHLMQKEKVEVSGHIESLSAVAEENAAATEQASACIEEQSAAIHTMEDSSATVADMAVHLNDMIGKFEV